MVAGIGSSADSALAGCEKCDRIMKRANIHHSAIVNKIRLEEDDNCRRSQDSDKCQEISKRCTLQLLGRDVFTSHPTGLPCMGGTAFYQYLWLSSGGWPGVPLQCDS